MIPNITSLRENLMENESSKHRGIPQTREQIFINTYRTRKANLFTFTTIEKAAFNNRSKQESEI